MHRIALLLLSLLLGQAQAQSDTAASAPETPPARSAAQNKSLRQKVAKLGFATTVLKAKMYASTVTEGQYAYVDTLENWLVEVLAKGKFTTVSRITADRFEGVGLKREGRPTSGFLFRKDGGELFVTHYVRGEELLRADEIPVRLIFLETLRVHFDNLR